MTAAVHAAAIDAVSEGLVGKERSAAQAADVALPTVRFPVVAKAVSQHVEQLQPVAELLGE